MITITELRARHNRMTQLKLAKELGVNKNSVNRWEADIMDINATNLKKIAEYFNVSTDDLLGINVKDGDIN